MTTGTLRGLLALGDAPRSRVALMVALGSTTIVFGVGLMATAGYLISRAAEQPAILSLTAAIVGVRFFGIARPIARYFDRLSSHDLAFRFLGGVRSRVYDRIEPLAPAQLEGHRRGDLLSRLVADVDSLQNLHLRGIGPPLVGIFAGAVSVAVAAAFLPAAGLVLGLDGAAGGRLHAGSSRRSSSKPFPGAPSSSPSDAQTIASAGFASPTTGSSATRGGPRSGTAPARGSGWSSPAPRSPEYLPSPYPRTRPAISTG